MKKYLAVLVLVGLFAVVPVHAQTSSTQSQSALQTTLDSLRAQLSQLYSQLPTATAQSATPKTLTTTSNVSTMSSTNGCGKTLTPFGAVNQTIRCDGRNWVAASNLLNNGINVAIGYEPATSGSGLNGSRLFVTADPASSPYSAGIQGQSQRGSGIIGQSVEGVGITGISFGTVSSPDSAIAIKALQNNVGYGFYQQGVSGKNNLEGGLSVGYLNGTTPTNDAKLKVAGGVQILPSTDAGTPVCEYNARGVFWFVRGDTGVKDSVQVCAKDATGTFAWRTLY